MGARPPDACATATTMLRTMNSRRSQGGPFVFLTSTSRHTRATQTSLATCSPRSSDRWGENVDIRPPLRVDYGYNITIGDGSWVNFGLTALDVAPIVIGADVLIGPNCSLYTAIHPTEPGPRRAKWESSAPITLEDNVWLGGSVVVCPGVTIGENSIIGAGAVVTRSIPPNSVAVGNPARVIKALDPSVPRAIETASVGVISRGETGERA